MKLVLFLNKDIEANITYNLLKPELLKHTVTIYYSDTVGNPRNKPSDLIRLEHFESTFFLNDLTTFIEKNNIEHTFEFFEQDFQSFPMEKCVDVNSKEFITRMQDLNPDLFISIRFGKIFKNEIIKIPKKGLINLHSAVLPDFRGIMGTLHAIKKKNTTIGCTLHTISDNGIDTGEIIEIAEINTNYQKSLFWNIVQLYPPGALAIIKTLRLLDQNHPLNTRKQDLSKGDYFSVPSKDDFDQIKDLGMRIISFEDYLEVIAEFIVTSNQKNLFASSFSGLAGMKTS